MWNCLVRSAGAGIVVLGVVILFIAKMHLDVTGATALGIHGAALTAAGLALSNWRAE